MENIELLEGVAAAIQDGEKHAITDAVTASLRVSLDEIVREIQKGREDLYIVLWERVRRFAAKLAGAWMATQTATGTGRETYSGQTMEDLMQSAFVALVEAVPKFDTERGGFLTYYRFFVRRCFRRYSGRPANSRKPEDPSFSARSLSAPLDPGDADGGTIEETVPDKAAAAALDAVEDRIFNKDLAERVAALLSRLPADAADRLRRMYWRGDPVAKIAEDAGLTERQLRSRLDADRKRVRHALRRTPEGLEIRRYIEGATDYYLRFPAASQRRPVEEMTIFREDLWTKRTAEQADEMRVFDRIRTPEERPQPKIGRPGKIGSIRYNEPPEDLAGS